MMRAVRHAPWPWLWPAGIALLIVWGYSGVQADPAALLGAEGRRQMAAYLVKLFPPDLSRPTLADAGRGALETFAISFLGSVLAALGAVPLSVLTARTLLYRGVLYEGPGLGPVSRAVRVAIYAAAKAALNVLRTIPEIVWALLFVFLVGLGPFAGVLALACHTAGVLGKLFGEALEAADPRPLEALAGFGARRLTIVLYGVLPQAAPQFVSYTLYRWEVNIRAAAVLGFVGAGGLGQRIHIAISLFLDNRLLTLILAVFLMVTLVDALSAFLRRRLV